MTATSYTHLLYTNANQIMEAAMNDAAGLETWMSLPALGWATRDP